MEGAVGHQVDAIDLAAQRQLARAAVGIAERERAVERVLEQPLDDGAAAFHFHRQHAAGDARRAGRAEQAQPFDRRFARRRASPAPASAAAAKTRAPRSSVSAVMAPWPAACHAANTRSNSSCRNSPRSSGVRLSSSSGGSSSRSTSRGVELERAVEIALEAADRNARQHPRSGLAVEGRIGGRRARPADARPRCAPARAAPRRPPARAPAPPTGRCGPACVSATTWRGGASARTSWRNAEGSTMASSSSVMVESAKRRDARPSRSTNAARAPSSRLRSSGQPSDCSRKAGIEDAAPFALRPVGVDEADDLHLVELAVRRGGRVDNLHAAVAGARRERLGAEPAPDGRGRRRHVERRLGVVALVGARPAPRQASSTAARTRASRSASGSASSSGRRCWSRKARIAGHQAPTGCVVVSGAAVAAAAAAACAAGSAWRA